MEYSGGDVSEHLVAAVLRDTCASTHDEDDEHAPEHLSVPAKIESARARGNNNNNIARGGQGALRSDSVAETAGYGMGMGTTLSMPAFLQEKHALVGRDPAALAKAAAAVKLLC